MSLFQLRDLKDYNLSEELIKEETGNGMAVAANIKIDTSPILIYESVYGGHRTEFVEYMLDYLFELKVYSKIIFLIHPKIYEALSSKIEQAIKNKNIVIEKIADNQMAQLDAIPSFFKRALQEKQLLNHYFEKYNIGKLILLEIDTYQYILGSWSNSDFKNIRINGILFNPYVHGQSNHSGWKGKFKRLRKRFQLQWTLRHKGINSIFILNDEDGPKELNEILNAKTKFKNLPDPLIIRPFTKIDIREKYRIAKDTKILLLIGGIQRRKNIKTIIKSVLEVEDSTTQDYCLLILGKCKDDQYLTELNTLIQEAKNTQIIFENKLLDTDEFESAVQEAFLMFTIYNGFYSSSGIVNHAAKHGIPTIASKYGVIGAVTKNYNLGKTVDPTNRMEITDAIKMFLNNQVQSEKNEGFIKERQYQKFAQQLLTFDEKVV